MKIQKKYRSRIYSAALGLFFMVVANTQIALGQWSKDNLKSTTNLPQAPITKIITNIVQWLLMIFGFIAVMGFVISGIIYLLSAGDEDAQERAKRAMTYSIIGVVVGMAGLVVLYAVEALLGGQTEF